MSGNARIGPYCLRGTGQPDAAPECVVDSGEEHCRLISAKPRHRSFNGKTDLRGRRIYRLLIYEREIQKLSDHLDH